MDELVSAGISGSYIQIFVPTIGLIILGEITSFFYITRKAASLL